MERQTRDAKIAEMKNDRIMLQQRLDNIMAQIDREAPDKDLVAKAINLLRQIDQYSNGILLLQE